MPQERAMRAVTRRHNLDGLKPYLEYARMATETVSFVSVQNGIHAGILYTTCCIIVCGHRM